MVVLARLAAVAQPLHARGEPEVVGDDRAGIAQRAEVLGRIERQGASDPHRADRTAVAARQVCLRAVLDHRQAVALGDLQDRRHVGGLPVEMDGHDRDGAGRNRRGNRRRRQRQSIGIDIREHRPCAGHHDRQRGVGRRERAGHDLVAGADVERAQDEGERVGAGRHADRRRRARGLGELPFEGLELGAENEPAAIEHPGDGRVDRRPVLA